MHRKNSNKDKKTKLAKIEEENEDIAMPIAAIITGAKPRETTDAIKVAVIGGSPDIRHAFVENLTKKRKPLSSVLFYNNNETNFEIDEYLNIDITDAANHLSYNDAVIVLIMGDLQEFIQIFTNRIFNHSYQPELYLLQFDNDGLITRKKNDITHEIQTIPSTQFIDNKRALALSKLLLTTLKANALNKKQEIIHRQKNKNPKRK